MFALHVTLLARVDAADKQKANSLPKYDNTDRKNLISVNKEKAAARKNTQPVSWKQKDGKKHNEKRDHYKKKKQNRQNRLI